jgi:hypothetical protein
LYRAEQYVKQNKCDKARDNIENAVNSFGLYFATHIQRVNIHIYCTRDAQALFHVLNEELEWDNTNIKALLTRALIYNLSGYSDLAKSDYVAVEKLIPQSLSGKLGLISIKITKGDIKTAKHELIELIKQFPNNNTAKKMLNDINNNTYNPQDLNLFNPQ